ncbi:MAG: hypothetical protein JWM35_2129 [Verrucomicrobia bacterium]|nr:hypothetical protein [Verrucomicrobiota bacterium]
MGREEPSFGRVQVTKLCVGTIFDRESRPANLGTVNQRLFAFLCDLL